MMLHNLRERNSNSSGSENTGREKNTRVGSSLNTEVAPPMRYGLAAA